MASQEQEYDINEMIDKITPENLQEPVAWMYEREDGVGTLNFDRNFALIDKGYKEVPLYTHPAPIQEQEPVAWIKEVEVLYMKAHKADGIMNWKTNLGLKPEPDDVALYTHPAQPLSDDEINRMAKQAADFSISYHEFARAIEQAHNIGVKDVD